MNNWNYSPLKIENPSKIELRKILLTKRRQISFSERQLAARNAASLLFENNLFQKSQHIACYYPVNDELDCLPIIEMIWLAKKYGYLPVLSNSNDLHFNRYQPDSVLQNNRYNIPEPLDGETMALDKLDLVLVPLLGFDLKGNRLGMGAGYYDRTFQAQKQTQKPFLLGLGYEAQYVTNILRDDWDVKLDGMLTERKLLYFN